jgi:hypothetical protein
MKKLFLLLPFAFLLFISSAFSQKITDSERRSFNNLKPIKIDIDGDKIKDTIQPRLYKIISKPANRKKLKPFDTKHWIAFDLITSKGLKLKSIFKYEYGTAEADYWVYVLKSIGDINKDGKIDLLFYAGDDTSDERIWLVNKKNRFVVFRRKITDFNSW